MSARPNLALIGFMASGKSTVGRECARRLGYRFVDSDRIVRRMAQMTIPDIFAQRGEEAFRDFESEAIAQLAARRRAVIATGGGAVLRPQNVAALRVGCVVVLLEVAAETVLLRAGDRSSRPLLAGAEDPLARVQALLDDRMPVYRAAAHVVVQSGGGCVGDVAERVLAEYSAIAGGRRRGVGR